MAGKFSFLPSDYLQSNFRGDEQAVILLKRLFAGLGKDQLNCGKRVTCILRMAEERHGRLPAEAHEEMSGEFISI